jgi:hypothetical protein
MSTDWTPADLPDANAAADLRPPEVDYSAIAAVAGNDPLLIRRLRADIAVIARRTDDAGLRDLCVAVLRGSQSVRRVFEHPAFRQMALTSAEHLEEGLDRLDEEQREELLAGIGSRELPEQRQFALMEGRPLPAE